MMTRRSLEGALKCALRDLLREEARARGKSVSITILNMNIFNPSCIPRNHHHHHHHNSTISIFHHM